MRSLTFPPHIPKIKPFSFYAFPDSVEENQIAALDVGDRFLLLFFCFLSTAFCDEDKNVRGIPASRKKLPNLILSVSAEQTIREPVGWGTTAPVGEKKKKHSHWSRSEQKASSTVLKKKLSKTQRCYISTS